MALANKLGTFVYRKLPYFFQNMMVTIQGFKKYMDEKQYSDFKLYLDQLLKSQWYSISQLKEMQRKKLRQLIFHAYHNVPYYRKKFNQIGLQPEDIKSIDDIKSIPLLTKEEVKKNYNDLIARNVAKSTWVIQSTSGTTGSPLTVIMDRNTLIWEKVWIARHRVWGGYSHTDWRGTFGGYKIIPLTQEKPPFWRYNLVGKQILFSTHHMTAENLLYYVGKIKNSKINIIDGYPSAIYIFAKFLESKNIYLPIKAVFTGAEPVHNYQREIIERRFCCKIFDHYGLTEKVASAGECETHEGHHVTMESTIVEIIRIAKDPGKNRFGEIVGTSLVNYAMPLIRYRTGDLSAFISSECQCGRKLLRMKPVETKMEDIITTSSGRFISASNLTFPFKALSSINEAQIIQEDIDNVTIRIVKGIGYSDGTTKMLLKGLRSCLDNRIRICIEFVDEIKRTKTGKFRFVISKVPLDMD